MLLLGLRGNTQKNSCTNADLAHTNVAISVEEAAAKFSYDSRGFFF